MNLFTEFNPTSHEQWIAAVEKELKGLPFDGTITTKDEIEGIEFSKFADVRNSSSPSISFQRGSKSLNNDWFVGKLIEVKDEKIANQEALVALNQGANSLTFVLHKKNILWNALFAEISLDFIEVQFKTIDEEQTLNLKESFDNFSKKQLILLNDIQIENSIDKSYHGVQLAINAFAVHQAGGNAIQEISFALSAGHSALHRLLESGFAIDDASAMLRFEMGIGANYFVEVAKFQVFRKLWATVIEAYHPNENCSYSCFIYAKTGFVNKSLKDPYTNLLRQTTEEMSAILGGVNEIQIQAFDKYSQSANRSLSERMAINISNLLKEESYFDKVIDPLGGSYNLDLISKTIEEKAWSLFQEIEIVNGIGTEQGLSILQKKVNETADLRKQKVKKGETILIGVNKFPNPDEKPTEWLDISAYMGFEPLILEKV